MFSTRGRDSELGDGLSWEPSSDAAQAAHASKDAPTATLCITPIPRNSPAKPLSKASCEPRFGQGVVKQLLVLSIITE